MCPLPNRELTDYDGAERCLLAFGPIGQFYSFVITQRKPMCDMPVSGVQPCRALGR